MFYVALKVLMERGEDSCWVCGCLTVFIAGAEKKKNCHTLFAYIFV